VKFMIIRKADANTEAGTMPSEALITAMMAYNAELAKAGALVDGVGLRPSSAGARVAFKNGQPTVIDGPFTETKIEDFGEVAIEAAKGLK
jgi:hypothetical protein